MHFTFSISTIVSLLAVSGHLLVSAAPMPNGAANLHIRDHPADATHQCVATGYGYVDCAQAHKCVGETQRQACQFFEMSTGNCKSDGWAPPTACATGTKCIAKGTATKSYPSGVTYDQCIFTYDISA